MEKMVRIEKKMEKKMKNNGENNGENNGGKKRKKMEEEKEKIEIMGNMVKKPESNLKSEKQELYLWTSGRQS